MNDLILSRAYRKMIRAYKGIDCEDTIEHALGYKSLKAVENRVDGNNGQDFYVKKALKLQQVSGTTHFAEAVAQFSGGVFIKLPEYQETDREELFTKFNALYAEVGKLAGQFNDFTCDDEIDKKEKHSLAETGQKIHKDVQELLSLAFAIYCNDNE